MSCNARAAFLKLNWFTSEPCPADVYGAVSAITRDVADVYGAVSTRTQDVSDPRFSRLLFLKQPECRVSMKTGYPVPLSRSVIAVLLGHNPFLDVTMVAEHAKIKAIFELEHCDKVKTLLGSNSEIKAEKLRF